MTSLNLLIHRPALAHIARPSGPLTGPRGLVTAVIHQARADLTSPDPAIQADALAYFAGPVYRRDLDILGMDPETLPLGITRQ